MAKQIGQDSAAVSLEQLSSKPADSYCRQHHDSKQPTDAASLGRAGAAAPCGNAAPAVVNITHPSFSHRSSTVAAKDPLRGVSIANAIPLEDDVSDDETHPANVAGVAQQQQQQRGEPRRLNRLRRAGTHMSEGNAASSNAQQEGADTAGASVDGLVTGFGSLQVFAAVPP
jgi:hypothetical protein